MVISGDRIMHRMKCSCLNAIVILMLWLGVALASASNSAAKSVLQDTVQSASHSASEVPGTSETLLPNGQLLVIGGQVSGQLSTAAFLQDSRTGSVTQIAGKLNHARSYHTATLLPNGTVLIVGGIGNGNGVVSQAELFDPVSQKFGDVETAGLTPRAYHTATVLTDGRVLFAGGIDASGANRNLELWDFRQGQASKLGITLQTARMRHTATLLPNGSVLLWGGVDDLGDHLEYGVLIDSRASTIQVESMPAVNNVQPPQLEESVPQDGATDVPADVLIALRFSKPLDVTTVNSSNISLTTSQGALNIKVVPAEGGRLAFVSPQAVLASDAIYTLSLQSLKDSSGQALPSTAIEFATVGGATGGAGAGGTGSGLDSPWRNLPPLSAPSGVTALAGQVLKLNGYPLPHVRLEIDSKSVFTDKTGRFLMAGLTAGHHVMYIDAGTASTKTQVYGFYRVGVDLTEGKTTALNYTIWMTPLDTQHVVNFPSPTTSEVVVTNPDIPGLELHIPPNTVVRNARGRVITQLGITPIPMNQPPFPLKPGVVFPVYFTIQPGGSSFATNTRTWSPADGSPKGAQIYYQNYPNAKANTPFNFWNYDPFQKGWYVYGKGRVSSDKKMIVPDNGTQIWSFDGAMVSNPDKAPSRGPLPCPPGPPGPPGPLPPPRRCGGDPVDLQTGLFVYTQTDLVLPDVIPIELTRTYRSNDSIPRSFGIGTNFDYDMFTVGDDYTTTEGYTYQDLVLADGGRIHFTRTSPCNADGFCDFNGAVYTATSTATDYYGATLVWVSGFPSGSWTLTKKDGTKYVFPDSSGVNDPRGAAVRSIIDRYGNALTLTRDGNGLLTKITSPNGRWIQFTYDASKRIIEAEDNIGRQVTYTYDALGRLSTVTDPTRTGVTTYTYDNNDNMLTIKDARDNVYLTNHYDANGRVDQQTHIDTGVFYFTYQVDANDNVTQATETDPRGYVHQETFNAEGFTLTDTVALGQPEQQTTTYSPQSGNGLLASAIDALGRQTTYTYDAMGNARSVTQLAETANAVTTYYTYEPKFNQLASITDPLGHTTSFTYDDYGNRVAVTDALGNATTVSYNSAGQPTSVTDPLGNTTQFSYDAGDLVGITDALGRTTSRFVDAAGRLGSITDPLGNITRFEYDGLNHITSTTDAQGKQTLFTYDGNGNLKTVKDANQNLTSYTYDALNHVQTRTDPLQNPIETYQYDLMGNLTQFTDRRGKVTTYSYDGLNRRTFAGFGTQAGPTYESTINYTFDAGDRLRQTVDSSSGTITRGFDDLNRLTSETTPQGAVSYTYDAAGRRQTMTVAGQPVVNYTFDPAGELTQISQGTNTIGITYDAGHRRSTLTLPNGVVVNYSYDQGSQLTGITYQKGAAVLGNLAYAYDLAGRRVGVTGSFARTNLPSPGSTAGSPNANNQLTNWNGTAISYDASGNMLSNGGQTYTWNARNQLASLNGDSFQYDAFGRRTKNAAGTNFLYDGVNSVQELAGTTPTANILAGGVDENFLRSDAGGNWSFLSDPLGSTLALTDVNGAVQTQYSYEPFGNTTASGLSTSNPAQYTGRENDGTGLYYYRARYYAPQIGRFINEDPIGFRGGINLYGYVNNDPLNLADPFGLCSRIPGDCTYERQQWGQALIDLFKAITNTGGTMGGIPIPKPGPITSPKGVGKVAWDGAKAIRKYKDAQDRYVECEWENAFPRFPW